MSESLMLRLKNAVRRERDAVLRRDWTEARKANEEARECQEVIREALRPNTRSATTVTDSFQKTGVQS